MFEDARNVENACNIQEDLQIQKYNCNFHTNFGILIALIASLSI